jgi:uncharacterized membrane protein YccC
VLYAELGDFGDALLVQRLEETAIGAVVAAVVVLAVLPLHASRVARAALRGYFWPPRGATAVRPISPCATSG